MDAHGARIWLSLLLTCLTCFFPVGSRATTLGPSSTTDDANYQTALTAIESRDYSAALVYLNQSLTNNADNGYVYLAKAKIDLLFYLPGTAVTDATSGVSLLRDSQTCDQFLQNDNPLLVVTGTGLGSLAAYNSLYGYGSILNLTSTGSLSSTSSTTSTTSDTTSTDTSTSSTSGTSSTTGSSTSSSSSSSSTSVSDTLFASSSGSQNLPVAEDLTDKDKEKNENQNEYNKLLTEMTMYSAYCGGIYLNNKSALVEGYTVLGRGYLLGATYASAQQGFAAALSLDEEDAKATAGLGLAYLGQGAASAALSALNLAVTYAPEEPAVYVARGAYWVSVGDYSRAEEEYQTALSLDATYTPAYASLGLLRAVQGEYSQAIESYDKALAINSSDVLVLVARAASWTALASSTTDSSQAATAQQNAEKDLAQAQALQETVSSATLTTYSTSIISTTSESTTTYLTTPVIGTFY